MRRNVGCLLVVALVMLGFSATAHATRHQGGTINWERDATFVSQTSARYKVHVELAFRWSFPWNSPVGAYPPVGTVLPEQFFLTNSAAAISAPVQLRIIATNPPTRADPADVLLNDDWMLAVGDATITVPLTSLPLTLGLESCCRNARTFDGNASRQFRLETVLTSPMGPLRSPRALNLPRIISETSQLLDLHLPIIDSDGGFVSLVRPSTAAESGLLTPIPPGLTLLPNGHMTWVPGAAGFYAMQATVENASGAKIPVDMTFDIVPPRPHLSFGEGFCGSTVPAYVGIETVMPFTLTSPIQGDTITLNATGLATGMTLATAPPYSIRWTRALGQDTATVCLLATSTAGLTTFGSCCVTAQAATVVIPHVCGPSDGRELLPADYAATSTFLGTASLASGGLQLSNFGPANRQDAVAGAAWLTGGGLPTGNGFSLSFKLTMNRATATTPSEGFAFVIQNSGPTALGGANAFPAPGGGLGYDGLARSLAVEFDTHQDAAMGDPSYSHVSVHSRYTSPNSASENSTGRLGTSLYNGDLVLGFDNGTTQDVRIEYRPAAQATIPGQPSLGALKIFLNKNLTPTLETQVDDDLLRDALGSTPYWGFTTSKDLASDQKIVISSVSLEASVGASARVAVPPLPISPGTVGGFVLQAVDQCGAALRSGGEANRFTVTITDGITEIPAQIIDGGDGKYTVSYTAPPTTGVWRVNVTFGGVAIAGDPIDVNVVPPNVAPPSILRPWDGEVSTARPLPVSGTGVPGATVTVMEGAQVLAQPVVAADGTFSLTLPLDFGPHLLSASQVLNGYASALSEAVAVTIAPPPPVITSPPPGSHARTLTVVITGTGVPGATVQGTGTNGTANPPQIATTTVDATGHFSTTVSSLYRPSNELTLTQTVAGLTSAPASLSLLLPRLPPTFVYIETNFIVEATGSATPRPVLIPEARTEGGTPVVVSCTPTTYSAASPGITTVTCTATDFDGLTAQFSYAYTVVDRTAPTLTVSPDRVVETTSSTGAVVTYAAPTATDLVDGNLSAAAHCTPASGSTFASGKTTVSCSVTDAAGNRAVKTFSVTVFDSTGPEFSAPPDLAVEAVTSAGAVVTFAVPTANDEVDGAVPVTCLPASGSLFPLGETIVQCMASDVPGNVTTKTFKVTVADTTPPQLSGVPAGGTVPATTLGGTVVTYVAPTAVDAVDGPLPVICTPPSGSFFGLGLSAVLCQATDASGHVASALFPITVVDLAPPALALPGTLTAEATGPTGAVVTFSVSALDVVDGALPVGCSASSGDTFPIGSTAVQCSATDLRGNVSTGGFTVVVKDTIAPVISGVPAARTVAATSAAGAVVTYAQPTASDVVGAVEVQCAPPSGATFPIGTTTVTCTARDAAGNTGSATFGVTVRDDRGPVFGPTPSPTAYATSTRGAVVTYASPKAVDTIDGQRPVTCTPASGSTFAPGSTMVTCKASDSGGNTTTVTFTVKVTYQAPKANCFFGDPIDGDGSSSFKLGSTVPVKFELTGASARITTLTAKLYVAKVANGVAGTLIEATSNGGSNSGNLFRYSDGKYIFNLSTKPLTKGTWLLKADLGDGVEHTVQISLR